MRQAILVLIIVSASLAAQIGWVFFNDWHPLSLDYSTFWAAARVDVSGLYEGPDFAFIYPPTGIAALGLLNYTTYWAGFALWSAFSATVFFVAVNRLEGWKIALLSFLSAAALQGLALGQTAMLFGAIVLLAVSLPALWCGLLLGLVASLKPQLLVMAPLILIVRRDWKTLAGAVGGFTASVGISLALWGVEPWLDWLKFIPQFQAYLNEQQIIESTITMAGQADGFGANPLPFLLLQLVIAVFIAIRADPSLKGVKLAGLMVGTSVMASPYSLTHDTIAVIPMVVLSLLALNLRTFLATAVYWGVALPVALPSFLAATCIGWRQTDSEGGRAAAV